MGALAPGGPLHERQMIQRIDPPSGRPVLLNAGFALDAYIAHWLHCHGASRAFDTRAIVWTSHRDLGTFPDRARSRAEPIVRLLEHGRSTRSPLPIVALIGQPGSGRTATAMA